MLNCRSCLHRQISSLLSIHAPTARALSFSRPSLARTFEYSNNRRPDSNSRDDRRSSRPAPRPRDRDEPRPKDRMGARGHTDKEPLDPRYVIIPQGIRGGFKKETRDPRDVVIQVEAYLGVGDVAKAHRLVENLSGKIDTVVAWNQLIRRSMDEGKHARAMRFYNDMKKRGISPDTFTYSHMLAGFASQKECLPQFVTEAFKIYEHLKNNKNVRQDIIHTNGLLSVCMKANDMEKAWEILSKLPNVGPNAPNPTTYTVFLRGLRGMGEEAISDGKRAWNGVLSRWGKGDLIIDEYLANAYLDLLLSGESPENWREVFIAAHQIYDLPLPTKIRVARPDDSFYDRWLTPDDFTLGILLRAAEKLKDFSLAKQTWVAITKENFTIRPSPIATQLFLRCASICHAGADVVGILAGSTERLTEWNFVVAMKACVHSGGARGSMENARRVLESCENAKKIGLMVIRTYLLVALTTKDAGLIKHALLRIERHLTPKALKVITTNPHDLPRDQSETVTKFLFTLKKAVFWDRIMWGRHEEVQWVERLREVRKTLQTWDNQTEEEEAVVVADEAERLIIAKQAKSLLEAEKKKLDVVQSVEEVMAGLRKFSSKQRREFISSL